MGENILYIDAVPTAEVTNPPYTAMPFNEGEDGVEAFNVRFDSGFEGDLSVKICSLMAEDFYVYIDGEEYSYAVRGAKQTDPGYAMIAGPFDENTVITCKWGRVSAGVYMQEDMENVAREKEDKDITPKTAQLPFYIRGASKVLVSRAFGIVLVEPGEEGTALLEPCPETGLRVDGEDVETAYELQPFPEDIYKSIEINAGDDAYHLVIKNPQKTNDNEQGPDAFMNVTGSFAGELCYRTGDAEDDTKGTYHTTCDRKFGADPVTGYIWGRVDEEGKCLAFQVEEGLYGINIVPAEGAATYTVLSGGKEKKYGLPDESQNDDGTTVLNIRIRLGNGIVYIKCFDKDGCGCAVGKLEIRTLSTTAHASDYVPAAMPDENTQTEEPLMAPAEKT
ncbi:MAG: hypothetical protein K6E95_07380, partial [Lachnospiraceae bacterium]|nr:hypothetical protein [Lachnospiraceae bacterium]